MDSTLHRPFASALALFCFTAFWLSVPALAENVGDPCTGTNRAYSVSGETTSLLICNGSTLELLEKDLANPVRKGIGTASPAATLHVNGEAIIGNTSLACSGTTEGALRYNSSSSKIEYCDGASWIAFLIAGGSGSPPAVPGDGYFVLTSGAWNGNLGGKSGADATCLSDLTANDWMGKTDANSRGLLVSSKVEAFLCVGSSCEMANPNTRYFFAVSGDNTKGNAYFDATAGGLGPNNSYSWSASNYFGTGAFYWTGRGTGSQDENFENTLDSARCSEWTSSSSGVQGRQGNSANTDRYRWSWNSVSCDQTRRLICFVHP